MPTGRPLRLLLVGDPNSVHVRRWGLFFAERGHEVHGAGLWGPDPSDLGAPFRIHRLGSPALAVVRLRRLAQALDIDILHAHYLTHYGWLARLTGFRPYVVTLWGSDVLLDIGRSRLRRAWARATLRGAACVTVDSPEVAAIATELGATPARIHAVQFGIDTARFAPGPRPDALLASLGLTERRIVFSPRALTPLYRQAILVEALATLPEDVVLVGTLAGADGAYVDHVLGMASRLGVRDRVVLVPPVPHHQIDLFYRAASVVASIPVSDATPVSVLEAIAIGVPVVATDLPSVRPWLERAQSELLVPIDDAPATSRALRRALDLSDQERSHIRAIGRAIAIARADQKANMLRMEALYRELLRR